jgi:hypothetical protein
VNDDCELGPEGSFVVASFCVKSLNHDAPSRKQKQAESRNPLKPKLACNVFKNPVSTAKQIQLVSII